MVWEIMWIQSEPGNKTCPVSSSAMIQPTDQISTGEGEREREELRWRERERAYLSVSSASSSALSREPSNAVL